MGLVPTMGALHAGHLSLVGRSVTQCDVTFVTISSIRLSLAPVRTSRDIAYLGNRLADAARDVRMWCMLRRWIRSTVAGSRRYVEPPEVAQPWKGAARPGHFRGVARSS